MVAVDVVEELAIRLMTRQMLVHCTTVKHLLALFVGLYRLPDDTG